MGKYIKSHIMTGDSKNRKKRDFYQTPTYAINALLEREVFDKTESFCEPCVGKGRISEALKNKFGEDIDLYSSDLYEYKYNMNDYGVDLANNRNVRLKKENWFSEKSFTYVITNPPYKEETLIPIIKNCKFIASSKVVLLLKMVHLCGKDRYIEKIFRDPEFPLARVYCFVQRLNFGIRNKETGKKQSPTLDHAFYVWDRQHKGDPVIKWIYFNKKKKKLEEK